MITTILAVVMYVLLTCAAKKQNVWDYINTNKAVLGITIGVLVVLSLLGDTAIMLAVTAFLVPYLISYSIPSLVAKVVDIWGNVKGWLMGAFTDGPKEGVN